MRKLLFYGLLIVLISGSTFAQAVMSADREAWSVKMANATMKRHPLLATKWNYQFGLVLKGIEQVGRQTGDSKYYDYIEKNINYFINKQGNIQTYRLEDYSLDMINSGKLVLTKAVENPSPHP